MARLVGRGLQGLVDQREYPSQDLADLADLLGLATHLVPLDQQELEVLVDLAVQQAQQELQGLADRQELELAGHLDPQVLGHQVRVGLLG